MLELEVDRNVFVWDSHASVYQSDYDVRFPKTPNVESLFMGGELTQDIHKARIIYLFHLKDAHGLKKHLLLMGTLLLLDIYQEK
jgi:hypothetical protein